MVQFEPHTAGSCPAQHRYCAQVQRGSSAQQQQAGQTPVSCGLPSISNFRIGMAAQALVMDPEAVSLFCTWESICCGKLASSGKGRTLQPKVLQEEVELA